MPKKKSTRIALNGKTIETVKEFKLSGTIITDDLKWGKKKQFLVKRAYARMELLRQMSKSVKDKVHIYKTYIRSVLKQSSVVWNFNLTKKNEKELKCVQKVAVSIITRKRNSKTENLKEVGRRTRNPKRKEINFKCKISHFFLGNKKTESMFEKHITNHNMNF